MEQGKKISFEVGVFKQKQMFKKGYEISFRMYLNLCNAKFSRIDVGISSMAVNFAVVGVQITSQ